MIFLYSTLKGPGKAEDYWTYSVKIKLEIAAELLRLFCMISFKFFCFLYRVFQTNDLVGYASAYVYQNLVACASAFKVPKSIANLSVK